MEDIEARNEKIRADMAAKRPIVEIMAEHGLSYARIYQINNPKNQKEQKQRAYAMLKKARDQARAKEERRIAKIIAKGLDA